METLRTMAIFFACYELMKVIMPWIEKSWRLYNWELRQSRVTQVTVTEGKGNNANIDIQKQVYRPEQPCGMWLYFLINFVYSIWAIVIVLTFNIPYMLTGLAMNIWGKFVRSKKPSIPMVMVDGIVSAAILYCFILM